MTLVDRLNAINRQDRPLVDVAGVISGRGVKYSWAR